MLIDGDFVWAVCPLCGKRNWCTYDCEINSAAMLVFLCCPDCEDRKHDTHSRKKPS